MKELTGKDGGYVNALEGGGIQNMVGKYQGLVWLNKKQKIPVGYHV